MNNIKMNHEIKCAVVTGLTLLSTMPTALAAVNTWQGGVSTDFNTPGNWSLSALDVADISTFTGAAAVQPNVTADITVTQVNFLLGSSGYILSSTSPAALTLSSVTPIKGQHKAGTNYISANIIFSGGGTKGIQQAGPGTLVVSGNISEAVAGTKVTYSRVDSADGKYVITGLNSYSGETTFLDGYLTISTFGAIGEESSLGKGGTLVLGGSASSRYASLLYNGSGETTDKVLKIGTGSGSRTISTTGATGGLVFTADMVVYGASDLSTLGFSGENVGNVFGGKIINPSGYMTHVVKSGSGTWTFGGANTYTGTTTLNASGGTLLIDGNQSAATGNVVVNSGATLGGKGIIGGSTTILSGGKLAAGLATGSPKFNDDLALNAGATAIFEGVVPVDVAGQLSLVNNWTLKLGDGFKDGGSVTIFEYGTLAASPDLVPTFDVTALGFTPTTALSLTDTGSSIVLNGVKLPPSGVTVICVR